MSGNEWEDNFPVIDDATMATWRAEAKANPPNPDDWAHLIGMLRLAAELDRHGAKHPDEPGAAIGASECALDAVVKFLQKQPYLNLRGEAVAPLVRLRLALRDVTEGRAPPMFKTVGAARRNPGRGQAEMMIQGLAAKALSEFIEAGTAPKVAAARIATALQGAAQRRMGKIDAKTVINWRNRLMQGPGPGSPPMALAHFKAPVESGLGETASAKAESLLKVLRERSASLL